MVHKEPQLKSKTFISCSWKTESEDGLLSLSDLAKETYKTIIYGLSNANKNELKWLIDNVETVKKHTNLRYYICKYI